MDERVYNYNPVAWSGIEIFFKHVKTVKQNFLAEEQTITSRMSTSTPGSMR